jgi:SAM-dependent methyltransferase
MQCGREYGSTVDGIKLSVTESPSEFQGRKSSFAPKLFCWRNYRKEAEFFRAILEKRRSIIDLATGDGSLTKAALFGNRNNRALEAFCIDFFPGALSLARRKLKKFPVKFVRADVQRLPFASESVEAMSCFGGFGFFEQGEKSLKEIARVLKRGGILRGSLPVEPGLSWRGRLKEALSENLFEGWILDSGLKLSIKERCGPVLFFELTKSER